MIDLQLSPIHFDRIIELAKKSKESKSDEYLISYLEFVKQKQLCRHDCRQPVPAGDFDLDDIPF